MNQRMRVTRHSLGFLLTIRYDAGIQRLFVVRLRIRCKASIRWRNLLNETGQDAAIEGSFLDCKAPKWLLH